MSATDPIPPVFQELLRTISANHESVGGEQHKAIAEIQVRSIMATERSSDVYEKAGYELKSATEKSGNDLKAATNGLKWMTAALVLATFTLGLITLLK